MLYMDARAFLGGPRAKLPPMLKSICHISGSLRPMTQTLPNMTGADG